MQLTRSALLAQYQRDPEFRSSIIYYGVSFIIALFAAILPSNLFLSIFAALMLGTFFSTLSFNYRPAFTLQSSLLGWISGASLVWIVKYYGDLLPYFMCYCFVMAVFHFSEFIFTALTNRRSLLPDSFLLNHSREYWVAAIVSWTEFYLEAWLLPGLKVWWVCVLGFSLCLLGEVIRKTAMVHAGVGFTHRLALSKRPDHRLVTTGIYAYLRHPGYTGWFLWSVGTQIVLCNPLCIVAYAVVSWRFFNDRIYDEERDLYHFFGDSYTEYQKKVWIGIPFVKGYEL